MVTTSYSYTEHRSSSHAAGGSTAASHAAADFIEATGREKKELQGLNERLSIYIEKVRKLEEQNKILVAELEELRGSFGSSVSSVKVRFTESLRQTRSEIDQAVSDTCGIEVRVNRLRDDVNDYRNRYEEVRREVERERTQWGAAIHAAREDLERQKAMYLSIQGEEEHLYKDQERLYEELRIAKDELDKAVHERLDFQRREQNLQAELDFLHRVHTQEVTELRGLLATAPADTREFFKNELALAIRDIKAEYDAIIVSNAENMRHMYESKVIAFEDSIESQREVAATREVEVTKMKESMSALQVKFHELERKNRELEAEAHKLDMQLREDQRQYEEELSKRDTALRFMREDCQTLVAELQSLLNTKQTLDAEIAIYRKMLEKEETRIGTYHVQERKIEHHHEASGEQTMRSTFTRSAKGNVSIVECEPFGKYIVLENESGSITEDISGYQIIRTIDGVTAIRYTVPRSTVLGAHQRLTIYSRGGGGIHGHDSIIFDGEASWGQGAVVVTTLLNAHGVERAIFTQKNFHSHSH
ncbi:hypothetical protein WR25_13816 [Diploscapter pachys]|uniref:IF rod domain-containing protein n=1 Tax=Diploscapter pachys TaxID=2018661 RepID=A0A2A2J2J8_9BILA|nr:hypothetical protein WR25_13816 [Diploscapter pachys]